MSRLPSRLHTLPSVAALTMVAIAKSRSPPMYFAEATRSAPPTGRVITKIALLSQGAPSEVSPTVTARRIAISHCHRLPPEKASPMLITIAKMAATGAGFLRCRSRCVVPIAHSLPIAIAHPCVIRALIPTPAITAHAVATGHPGCPAGTATRAVPSLVGTPSRADRACAVFIPTWAAPARSHTTGRSRYRKWPEVDGQSC